MLIENEFISGAEQFTEPIEHSLCPFSFNNQCHSYRIEAIGCELSGFLLTYEIYQSFCSIYLRHTIESHQIWRWIITNLRSHTHTSHIPIRIELCSSTYRRVNLLNWINVMWDHRCVYFTLARRDSHMGWNMEELCIHKKNFGHCLLLNSVETFQQEVRFIIRSSYKIRYK